MKVLKGNNLISKSREFHNVGAAYTKDRSKNELAHVLLIGETHNKQGSKDARVRIVVLLTLSCHTAPSGHTARMDAKSTRSVHKSVTLRCVFVLVQLNKCVVVCGSLLRRAHSGDEGLSSSNLFTC